MNENRQNIFFSFRIRNDSKNLRTEFKGFGYRILSTSVYLCVWIYSLQNKSKKRAIKGDVKFEEKVRKERKMIARNKVKKNPKIGR